MNLHADTISDWNQVWVHTSGYDTDQMMFKSCYIHLPKLGTVEMAHAKCHKTRLIFILVWEM